MSIEFDKRAARNAAKRTLRSLDDELILKKSERVGINLFKLLNKIRSDHSQKKLSTLGVYSPLAKEVNWTVENSISSNWDLSFPSFCEVSGMRFRAQGEGLVKSDEFGVEILAPARGAQELLPDICLVPGLAFSAKGERLGRGKGFYDRYLEQFTGVSIGLAFSEQVVDSIPTQAHDELIEFLVSEENIYWQGKPYELQLNTEDI